MKSHGITFYSQLTYCVKEAFIPFKQNIQPVLQRMQCGSENYPLVTKLESMFICSGPQDGNASHLL